MDKRLKKDGLPVYRKEELIGKKVLSEKDYEVIKADLAKGAHTNLDYRFKYYIKVLVEEIKNKFIIKYLYDGI